MPWYAKLEQLPQGYDNTREAVFWLGKEYRVSKHTIPHQVAIHTPNSIVTPIMYVDVDMARRLFRKPYWKDEE